jgi:chromosome segregation ATPase
MTQKKVKQLKSKNEKLKEKKLSLCKRYEKDKKMGLKNLKKTFFEIRKALPRLYWDLLGFKKNASN